MSVTVNLVAMCDKNSHDHSIPDKGHYIFYITYIGMDPYFDLADLMKFA